MTQNELIKIAQTIYGESGVFVGKCHDALIGTAQAIHDIWKSGIVGNTIDDVLDKAFQGKSDIVDAECLQAAEEVFNQGTRRFPNYEILQTRSYLKYSDGAGNPDLDKCYNTPEAYKRVPADYEYIGKDGISEKWGCFYFGRKEEGKMFRMLLIAGHGDGDVGATGNGYQEADLARELVPLIHYVATERGISCDVACTDLNWYQYLKAGNQMDFSPYQYVLEVHFNHRAQMGDSAADGVISGSMFYLHPREMDHHSVEDAILANLYAIGSRKAWDGIVNAHQVYQGGLLVQNRVEEQGVPHALLETCFISDPDDVEWYQMYKEKIAQAIVTGIQQGFGLENTTLCGKGFATAEALDAMNVRLSARLDGKWCGNVQKGQKVEVLNKLPSGWLQIVWPGTACGYAYTSNVGGQYYRYI